MSSFSQTQACEEVEIGKGLRFLHGVSKISFGAQFSRMGKLSIASSPLQPECLQKLGESYKSTTLV